MKITQLSGLRAFVAGKRRADLPPVFVVCADDEFERSEAVKLLFTAMGLSNHQVESWDGEQLSTQRLCEELATSSLFTQQSVIHIVNGDKLASAAIEEIVRFSCLSMSCHTVILEMSELKPNLLSALADRTAIVSLATPPPWEKGKAAVSWLRERATAHQVSLAAPAAELLIRRCGLDKRLLAQELDKLVCYSAGRPIDEAAVEALAVAVASESIWELGSAVQQRQSKRALEIWRNLVDQQATPLAVLGALRSQLQTGYRLSSALSRGADASELAKLAPQLKGKLLEMNISMARSYGIESYRQALLELYAAELSYKGDNPPEQALMEMLIVRMTRKNNDSSTYSLA